MPRSIRTGPRLSRVDPSRFVRITLEIMGPDNKPDGRSAMSFLQLRDIPVGDFVHTLVTVCEMQDAPPSAEEDMR